MKHVRYVGNTITFLGAVVLAASTVFPALAIPFVLSCEISFATLFLSACGILCTIGMCWAFRVENILLQIYSWCEFRKDSVIIRTLFQKKYQIDYEKCIDVGIGYYIHGGLVSNVGMRIMFIYLSYQKVAPKYKCQINSLKPTRTCIKIGFRKKTYQYLLNNLPQRQSKMLEISYASFQRK